MKGVSRHSLTDCTKQVASKLPGKNPRGNKTTPHKARPKKATSKPEALASTVNLTRLEGLDWRTNQVQNKCPVTSYKPRHTRMS